MKSKVPLGQTRPIRLFTADDAEIKKLAAGLGIAEQDIIRRLIAFGIKSWKEQGEDLNKLIPRNQDLVSQIPESPPKRKAG